MIISFSSAFPKSADNIGDKAENGGGGYPAEAERGQRKRVNDRDGHSVKGYRAQNAGDERSDDRPAVNAAGKPVPEPRQSDENERRGVYDIQNGRGNGNYAVKAEI